MQLYRKYIFCFYIFIIFCLTRAVCGILNDTEYDLLPRVTEIEDFDECQGEKPTLKYCVFDIELHPIPNVTSYVWELIQKFSQDIRNVRHNIIQRGHCLPIGNLSKDDEIHKYMELYNDQYYHQGLQVRIQKMSCNYFERNFDVYDIAAIVIFTTIAAFILICTIIDYVTDEEVTTSPSFSIKFVRCFSITKNWQQLGDVSKTERSMHYVQSLRFIVMSLIIYGHLMMVYLNSPMYNPTYFDTAFHRISASIIINGPMVIQMFIFLSGFFFAINFFQLILKNKFQFKYIGLAIVGRYVRLIIPFAMVTLFSATLLYHTGSGAYWERNIGLERENCRKNWWTNILLLNNAVESNKMCIITGWYLAIDFHLTLIGLCLIILSWFTKNMIKEILAVCLIISCIIPGFLTYIYRLDPTVLTYPENLRVLFAGDKTFEIAYFKAYTNASSYILGITMAYYYCTGNIKKPRINPILFKILLYIGWIICSIGLMYGSYIFYTEYYVYNQLLSTLYASLYKLVWALAPVCVIWLANTVSDVTMDRKILEWTPLVVLGRLSFAVYITHWPVIQIINSIHTVPVYYGDWDVIMKYLSRLVIINVVACVFYLFIECPTANVFKLLIEPAPKKTSTEQSSNNNVVKNSSVINIQNNFNGKFSYENKAAVTE